MKTNEVKVCELTDAALDRAVAKSMGGHIGVANGDVCFDTGNGEGFNVFTPSTDWSQGGPIIEREEITVCWQGATWVGSKFNVRVTDEYEFHQTGPTPLIAAMRCYVASKLGDTVDVPPALIRTL